MTIRCILQGHNAIDDGVWNEGYRFSNCARCGANVIRSSGQWHAIPRGYKVVWRAGKHCHAIPANYSPSLPLVVARHPRWRLAWKLGMHRKGVGCIMLPSDIAYRDEEPVAGLSLSTILVTIAFIAIQATLRATTPKAV